MVHIYPPVYPFAPQFPIFYSIHLNITYIHFTQNYTFFFSRYIFFIFFFLVAKHDEKVARKRWKKKMISFWKIVCFNAKELYYMVKENEKFIFLHVKRKGKNLLFKWLKNVFSMNIPLFFPPIIALTRFTKSTSWAFKWPPSKQNVKLYVSLVFCFAFTRPFLCTI